MWCDWDRVDPAPRVPADDYRRCWDRRGCWDYQRCDLLRHFTRNVEFLVESLDSFESSESVSPSFLDAKLVTKR